MIFIIEIVRKKWSEVVACYQILSHTHKIFKNSEYLIMQTGSESVRLMSDILKKLYKLINSFELSTMCEFTPNFSFK